jgi:hypothetical protein
MTDNQTQAIKLYSKRSISIVTYFGGPFAAGILVRQNYISLGKDQFLEIESTNYFTRIFPSIQVENI